MTTQFHAEHPWAVSAVQSRKALLAEPWRLVQTELVGTVHTTPDSPVYFDSTPDDEHSLPSGNHPLVPDDDLVSLESSTYFQTDSHFLLESNLWRHAQF